MARSCSTDDTLPELTPAERATLLDLARQAIRHGLAHGRPLPAEQIPLEGAGARPMASFVTLYSNGALRGCVGNLSADYPLARGVAHNAWQAAFGDTRFPPLRPQELPGIEIEISLLSRPEPIHCDSEQALCELLVPFRDGLILSDGAARATFLPKVWEKLAEPVEFLRQLKLKAGLPADYWSDSLKFERYRSISWREHF